MIDLKPLYTNEPSATQELETLYETALINLAMKPRGIERQRNSTIVDYMIRTDTYSKDKLTQLKALFPECAIVAFHHTTKLFIWISFLPTP